MNKRIELLKAYILKTHEEHPDVPVSKVIERDLDFILMLVENQNDILKEKVKGRTN